MSAAVYRAPAVRLETRMQVVDFAGNPVSAVGAGGDVTDRLELGGSVISKDAGALVSGTAQFVFRDTRGFDPGRHLLKPVLTLRDTLTGRSVEREAGLWVMRPFVRSLRRDEQTTIDCDDVVSLLNTALIDDFNALDGEPVGFSLARLLRAHGLVGLTWVPPTIASNWTTSPSVPVTDPVTYLELANKILELVGFDRIYMTREGRLTSFPFNPVTQGDTTWDFDQDTFPWISEDTETEPYTGPRYNAWRGVSTAGDVFGFVEPVLRINDSPLHPYSIRNQGGRVVVKVLEAPAGTTTGLQLFVDRVAEADSLRYLRINIHSGPVLDIWHLDKVLVNIPDLGVVRQRGIVRRWSLPLDYGRADAVYTCDVGERGLDL